MQRTIVCRGVVTHADANQAASGLDILYVRWGQARWAEAGMVGTTTRRVPFFTLPEEACVIRNIPVSM